MSLRLLLATALTFSAAGAIGDLTAQSPEPRVVEIVAKHYSFEPATVTASVGETLRLMVVSADGPHGIEIKKFKVKKAIPRGTTPVVIEFTANEAGQFPILCSEYCGEGHNDMKGMLVVQAQDAQPPQEKN